MIEADWKVFKKLRMVALERFSQRVLDRCQTICTNQSLTAHQRYGELYKLLQVRDKEMAPAFDDFRRSTAVFCLRFMVGYGLLTEEELSKFSPETRHIATAEL